MKPIRRVVTGHDAQGKAIVAIDGVPPVSKSDLGQPGLVFTEIWSTADSPAPIGNEDDPTHGVFRLHPGPRGSVMRVIAVPPEQGTDAAPNAAMARQIFEAIGNTDAQTGGAAEAPHPMMHRTRTIDYAIVLEGELWMILDDSEVRLHAGDIVVQRGTNHAWSNRSDRLARIAFVLLDGVATPGIR